MFAETAPDKFDLRSESQNSQLRFQGFQGLDNGGPDPAIFSACKLQSLNFWLGASKEKIPMRTNE